MIILSIGSDAKLFESESAVRRRLIDQASWFDEIHVIVASKNILSGNSKVNINNKLYLYPVKSNFKIIIFFKLIYIFFVTARRLKRKQKDLYITSQDPFEVGLVSFFIAKLTRIKLQLQFHTDCFNILFIKHNLANYFRTLIARAIVSHVDSIRVVSERIKFSILSINNKLSNKIFVLPVRTDVEIIKDKEIYTEFNLRTKFPEFSKIILVVARLESEKNIELALSSFQKMLRHDDTLGLVIAGSGSKESWLKELVNYLGITNKVKFLGWVPEVSSLYKTSDILLVTSFYEGYGLNMVESVACGCPVVSTDVGVAEEVGATIVSYDAGEIALKVIEILNQRVNVELKKEFIIEKSEYMDRFKNTFI